MQQTFVILQVSSDVSWCLTIPCLKGIKRPMFIKVLRLVVFIRTTASNFGLEEVLPIQLKQNPDSSVITPEG